MKTKLTLALEIHLKIFHVNEELISDGSIYLV